MWTITTSEKIAINPVFMAMFDSVRTFALEGRNVYEIARILPQTGKLGTVRFDAHWLPRTLSFGKQPNREYEKEERVKNPCAKHGEGHEARLVASDPNVVARQSDVNPA